MIQPFSYIISKRVNDLKKCISNEPGTVLANENKRITVRQENAQVNIKVIQLSSTGISTILPALCFFTIKVTV